MEIALSKHLGQLFTIEQFDAQPAAVKAQHRHWGFTCPDQACGGDAGYRSRGRDGSAARFFGKHTPDCQLRSTTWQDHPAPGVTPVPQIDNTGVHITLIPDGLDPGTTATTLEAATAADPATPGPARRHDPTQGTVRRENTTRGLRRFLARLRTHPIAADDTTPITLPGADASMPLGQALRTPATLTGADEDQLRLVWGTLHQASTKNDIAPVFLRSGPYDAASFYLLVPNNLAATALHVLEWTSWTQATGAHFIAWGHIRRVKNNAPYIKIDTLNQFYLHH